MITAMTTEIFFVLKAANIKPPKASLDAIDVIKRAGGTCGWVLAKVFAVYKKIDQWVNDCLAAWHELWNKYFIA